MGTKVWPNDPVPPVIRMVCSSNIGPKFSAFQYGDPFRLATLWLRHNFGIGSHSVNLPLLQLDDLVAALQRRQPMRNDQNSQIFAQAVNRVHYRALGFVV